MNEKPRWEYPRPDFQRGTSEGIDWLNLNGTWHFAFDLDDIGEQAEWFASNQFPDTPLHIQVPYPWESLAAWGEEETADNATYLSKNAYLHPESVTCGGLERDGNYRDAPRHTIGWYRKRVSVPKTWNGNRVILHFGAVDWHAKVWVNGHFIGEHENGYLPFEFDITDALTPGEQTDIVVRAYDAQAHGEQTVGKQANWYVRTSGIWQTVYLEPRNASHLQQCHITPDIDASTATFDVKVEGDDDTCIIRWAVSGHNTPENEQSTTSIAGDAERLGRQVYLSERIATGQKTAEAMTQFTVHIPPEYLQLWDVDTPNLYDVTLELVSDDTVVDRVSTYFGMRKVSIEKAPGGDYQYIYLNNRPVYLLGALNQSFNPEGVYTFLTDEAIRTDIARAKEFGFNFLRLHIKVDEPRLYYWADKLGMLFMCDIPNFSTYTETAKTNLEATLRGTIARDYNHPSIISWCIFNETWGLGGREFNEHTERQEWVREMYHLAKDLDATRLVEDNSPCLYDHVETDINSWHFYINDYAQAKEHIANVVEQTYPGSGFNYAGDNVQSDAPLINSEYGGISAGAGDKDVSWCFKYLTNELRLHPKICGYVYTELQDIEWEHNGFMNYDRSVKEFGYDVCDINTLDFIAIDYPPGTTVAPGDTVAADIYASHFSHADITSATLHWRLDALDANGSLARGVASGTPVSIPFPPYRVEKVHRLELEIPDICQCGHPVVSSLHVWVEDATGAVVARNYINFEILKPSHPNQARHGISVYMPDTAAGSLTFLKNAALGHWMDANGETSAILLAGYYPGDVADMQWPTQSDAPEPTVTEQLLAAQGTGYAEYVFTLPAEKVVEIDNVDFGLRRGTPKHQTASPNALRLTEERLELVFEASAFNGGARQTEPEKYPTDVTISVNGVEIETVTLPDCPADARGALSYIHGEPGTYGYLTRITIEGEQLSRICAAGLETVTVRYAVKPDAENRGGFALYGNRRGRYPTAPHLIFL